MGRDVFDYFDPNDVNVSKFAYVRTTFQFTEREKGAKAMWKQIFQIQKYDLVNEKLKWNNNPRWEMNTIENKGVFLSILHFFF